jgi:hypothetical protein
MNGVREEAAPFIGEADTFAGPSRFRTFGPDGPLYEVMSVGDSTVRIHVFDNGEELDYRLDRALRDPVAR